MQSAFIVRIIIAASLYTIMGRATVWLDPISNAILVFGSRFFLVFAPFISSQLWGNAIPGATAFAALGATLLLLHGRAFLFTGATCLAIGVSVAGYLIRAYASENIGAAARNKIAINIGITLAGIALSFPILSNATIAVVSAVLLLFATCISRRIVSSRTRVELPGGGHASKLIRLAWVFFGLTMGIKLYSPFTLLPQYIVATTGSLTQWYGVVVLASSFFIVVFQKLVVHGVGKLGNDKGAMFTTWFAMFVGLCVIAAPSYFHAATFAGALFWVLILSLVECIASYLDVFGAKDNCLFTKELAVGAGGGLSALISRYSPHELSGPFLALTGIAFLATAVGLILISTSSYESRFRGYDAN